MSIRVIRGFRFLPYDSGPRTMDCQYDESRYPGYIVERMKSLHPVIVCEGEITRKSSLRQMTGTG